MWMELQVLRGLMEHHGLCPYLTTITPLQNQTKAKTKTQNKLTRSFEFSLVSLCLRPQTKCGIYSGKMVDLRIREERRKGVSGWN